MSLVVWIWNALENQAPTDQQLPGLRRIELRRSQQGFMGLSERATSDFGWVLNATK